MCGGGGTWGALIKPRFRREPDVQLFFEKPIDGQRKVSIPEYQLLHIPKHDANNGISFNLFF